MRCDVEDAIRPGVRVRTPSAQVLRASVFAKGCVLFGRAYVVMAM